MFFSDQFQYFKANIDQCISNVGVLFKGFKNIDGIRQQASN